MRKIICLALVSLCFTGYLGWFHTKAGCEIRDGHWAPNGSYCITRSCYKSKNCGNWASPIKRCGNLEIGDDISEVFFQLGQPLSISGTIYTWRAYKDEGYLNAEIEDGELKHLSCKAQ